MMLPVIQIVVVSCVIFFLYRWRAAVKRSNEQTWDSLLACVRHDWSAHELSEHFLWQEGISATPDEVWKRMQGARGLCVMYQNARVMLEMADYAECHSLDVDRVLLATLRSDAVQIRVCVVMALAQYAFTQASEGVRVNAYRAAQSYTGMAARMTQLLQENAAVVVPDFVSVM